MGVFSRLTDIVNSNLNAMLDRAEEPEKIVRLIIQEMEDTLVEVRSAAAKSIAEKKELTRKVEQFQAAQADWQAKAELAIAKGRDDLAKGALMAKARAAETVEVLNKELDQHRRGLGQGQGRHGASFRPSSPRPRTSRRAWISGARSANDRLRMRTQLHDGRIDDALVAV